MSKGCDYEGFDNCPKVACPCENCTGELRSDGRNKLNNLTFLVCNVCSCTYVAYDVGLEDE